MKLYIKKINHCFECPQFYYSVPWCGIANKLLPIYHRTGPPDWCPLPDTPRDNAEPPTGTAGKDTMNQKQTQQLPSPPVPRSVFDRCVNIDWPTVWKAIGTRKGHRAECDDRESLLTVIPDEQGDMHMDMIRHPMAEKCGGGFGTPTFRARTYVGGGRCERIRIALVLLALAISEDQPSAGGQ